MIKLLFSVWTADVLLLDPRHRIQIAYGTRELWRMMSGKHWVARKNYAIAAIVNQTYF